MNDCSPQYSDATHKCVADCPNGYTETLLNSCTTFEFCHSTCGECALKNNANECSTCSSTLALSYQPFTTLQPTGPCVITPTNNAQYLLTVNKDTLLGSSQLISVTYNTSIV